MARRQQKERQDEPEGFVIFDDCAEPADKVCQNPGSTPDIVQLRVQHEAHAKEIDSKIGRLRMKQSAVEELQTQLRQRRDECVAKRAEEREKLRFLMDESRHMREKMREMQKAARQKQAEIDEQGVAYSSVEEIEDHIIDVEFMLSTSSVTLKTEKQLMHWKSELKKEQPRLALVQSLEAQTLEHRSNIGELRKRMKHLNEVLDKTRAKMASHNAQMDEMIQQMKALREEKEDIRDELSKAFNEKRSLRASFRDACSTEKKRQQDIRAKALELRCAKHMQRRAKALALDQAEQEAAEHLDLELAIKYCRGLLPQSVSQKDHSMGCKMVESAPADFDGMTLLVKKEERDEFYSTPSRKCASAANRKQEPKRQGRSKAFKHNMYAFSLFSKFNMDPPLSEDELAAALQYLESLQWPLASGAHGLRQEPEYWN
mmetsp:Transcript_59260/g.109522  ORF Transcript_59260/g.109522 Transcript_59260/m.109522 type:complete len:430 (+) Transcript_59260:43-1332(+)